MSVKGKKEGNALEGRAAHVLSGTVKNCKGGEKLESIEPRQEPAQGIDNKASEGNRPRVQKKVRVSGGTENEGEGE